MASNKTVMKMKSLIVIVREVAFRLSICSLASALVVLSDMPETLSCDVEAVMVDVSDIHWPFAPC